MTADDPNHAARLAALERQHQEQAAQLAALMAVAEAAQRDVHRVRSDIRTLAAFLEHALDRARAQIRQQALFTALVDHLTDADPALLEHLQEAVRSAQDDDHDLRMTAAALRKALLPDVDPPDRNSAGSGPVPP